MRLGKQAKTLSDGQIRSTMDYLANTRSAERNRVVFLLSVKAGLRAKEIAAAEWQMVLNSSGEVGDAIALESKAAKKGGGGIIPLNRELKQAVVRLHDKEGGSGTDRIIRSERDDSAMSAQVIVNMFKRWYRDMGFEGCSSHSGRRTFITKLARNVSRVGGSMRDVQALARHSSLQLTQLYVDQDPKAQRKLVEMI